MVNRALLGGRIEPGGSEWSGTGRRECPDFTALPALAAQHVTGSCFDIQARPGRSLGTMHPMHAKMAANRQLVAASIRGGEGEILQAPASPPAATAGMRCRSRQI